jgi:hypothetical protein
MTARQKMHRFLSLFADALTTLGLDYAPGPATADTGELLPRGPGLAPVSVTLETVGGRPIDLRLWSALRPPLDVIVLACAAPLAPLLGPEDGGPVTLAP